jgi:hypothetical protein
MERRRVEVSLSAYEQGCDRLTRLARVASCMSQSLLEKVVRLHDHKGFLEVTSRVRLAAEEQRVIVRLWEMVGHEPECNVEFEVEEAE